jgi:hypothetical protein
MYIGEWMTIKSNKECVSELNNEWNDIDIKKIRNGDIRRREKMKKVQIYW